MNTAKRLIPNRIVLLVLICLFAILAADAAQPQQKEINIDSTIRYYTMYIPDNIKEYAPLVFMFHGYTGRVHDFMNETGMNRLADKYGFAVCYPQGTTDSRGNTFWQVGYDFTKDVAVDDIRFIRLLLPALRQTYKLSGENVFAGGFSNGGDMCNYIALKAPDLVKAIAPVGGCIMQNVYEAKNSDAPISVLMINGTRDDITYFTGSPDEGNYGAWLAVLTTFDYYVRRNRCNQYSLQYLSPIDNIALLTEKYSSSSNGKKVWLYQIVNGMHTWNSPIINTADEIWSFFSLFI